MHHKPFTIPLVFCLLLLGGCFDSQNDHSSIGSSLVTAAKINDTGISLCGDYAEGHSGTHNNSLDCAAVGATQTTASTDTQSDPVPAGQDAAFGRDALAAQGLLSKVGAGDAGFDFTKLDANGDALDASATDWHCVRDNVTGLIWEVKQGAPNATPAENLHDSDDLYTWYQTSNNGGLEGEPNTTTTCYGYDAGNADHYCNTSAFVARVNAEGLCGYNDWRLPSDEELLSIVHKGKFNPSIDIDYFPNTQPNDFYWSSTTAALDNHGAWKVSFYSGYTLLQNKDDDEFVRLVRGQ